MNLKKFIQEAHQNAVEHGFWDGERPIEETIALIHSEWSEALEEYRAGRPMVWHACDESPDETISICNPQDETECLNYGKESECKYHNPKPEGIAVELIDGCIRILDMFGQYSRTCSSTTIQELKNRIHASNPTLAKDTPLPTLVCALHSLTSAAGDRTFVFPNKAQAIAPLEAALGLVFFWTAENGIDPEALMMRKHEYNKTRPYMHGKKC